MVGKAHVLADCDAYIQVQVALCRLDTTLHEAVEHVQVIRPVVGGQDKSSPLLLKLSVSIPRALLGFEHNGT